MTAPMTPKLDEARLRELAEAAYHDYGVADIAIGGGMRVAVSVPAFIQAASPSAILALLDALSAERERGDRAVGLLRPFGADTIEGVFDNALVAQVRAFLATQKAEGAE